MRGDGTLLQTTREKPIKPVYFMARDVAYNKDDEGSIRLKSNIALRSCRQHLPAYLRYHAETNPDRPWLWARVADDGQWQNVTYGQALIIVDEFTQGLLNRMRRSRGPLAILSDNSIEHALLSLAAMQAGLPVVPLSPAYAGGTDDFQRLQHLLDVVRPAFLVFESTRRFGAALSSVRLDGVSLFHCAGDKDPEQRSVAVETLRAVPSHDVAAALALIDCDAPSRLMFTSGSTGVPKAAVHSQTAIVQSAESLLQTLGVSSNDRMVRLDWTPWSHVFGATSLALSLVSGGQFFIDRGRPTPAGMAETIRNLRDVRPVGYANVPYGFSALVEALEQDDVLARNFFMDVGYLSYAAARLPEGVTQRLQKLAIDHTGQCIAITSGYGATETCAAGAFVHWPTTTVGLIGLPQPGVEFKLVPLEENRFEVRQRGIGMFGGYYGDPAATQAMFDDEGWYRTGDAASFVDPGVAGEGLRFEGRLTEEFKLQTGIFVKVGPLRSALLETLGPIVRDIVLCGENANYLAALLWIDHAHCTGLASETGCGGEQLAVRQVIANGIAIFNTQHTGSSERIQRVMILDDPPCAKSGEITDKGSINQALVRRRRAAIIAKLFEDKSLDTIIDMDDVTVAAQSTVLTRQD